MLGSNGEEKFSYAHQCSVGLKCQCQGTVCLGPTKNLTLSGRAGIAVTLLAPFVLLCSQCLSQLYLSESNCFTEKPTLGIFRLASD